MNTNKITVRGADLTLIPEKAIYWKEKKALFIADLHLGKSNHFRKHGIPVPGLVGKNTLWRLSGIILKFRPQVIYFLGDLFHSDINRAWLEFSDFMAGYPSVKKVLIKGNHDILPEGVFSEAGFAITENLELPPFYLTHDREQHELYNLHGHIHPAVKLEGPARQRIRIPCFYFASDYAVLPSFGDFTGMYPIVPKIGDRVFISIENKVIEVS